MDIKLVQEINRNGFDIYKTSVDNEKIVRIEKSGEAKEFDKKELNRLIKELNKHLEKENTYAKYDVHKKFGDIMIKIISKETKEIIIEFPPEKVLDMVAKLCENAGIVLNKKA